ncbi:MAG: hypothetical protein J5I90_01105 [Caldilineales bacterium]|nr:hypothetical protein [Caldilineales bacterium]
MEWTGDWESQTMQVPLQISHGIVEAERALSCQDCHVPDGIMDFAALGYPEDSVAILESLSSPAGGKPQMFQVDFSVNDVQPLESSESEADPIKGPPSVPGLSAWSWFVAVMIVTAVLAVIVFLLWRLRDQLARAE